MIRPIMNLWQVNPTKQLSFKHKQLSILKKESPLTEKIGDSFFKASKNTLEQATDKAKQIISENEKVAEIGKKVIRTSKDLSEARGGKMIIVSPEDIIDSNGHWIHWPEFGTPVDTGIVNIEGEFNF